MEHDRDVHGLRILDGLWQDLRDTVRRLHKAPLFTSIAALSLAVGIGANAALFTVVDRVLLRPLPVSDPQELVLVTDQRIGRERSPRFSYPFYTLVRDSSVLNGAAARYSLSLTMNGTTSEHAARVRGELVSGNYFSVVGAGTHMGRALAPADDRAPGAHPVVVISEAFWRRSLASDPSAIGRDVRINDYTFTIVGVAAKGFTGVDVGRPTDVWLPMMMQKAVGRDLVTNAGTNWLEIIGRLKTGMSAERAEAGLTEHVGRAEAVQAHASGREKRRMMFLPGDKGSSPVRRELGPALMVLWMLTVLALVLACVNVASLLTVRSAAREKEIAVRLALGARRSHLIRQSLVETLVLAALGGAAALLIAPWAAGLLVASQPDRLGIDPGLDLRVLVFGFAVSVSTGLVVGLAPILATRKVGLSQAGGSVAGTGRATSRRPTAHDVVVACQIAVSLAMLITAALLVQSLRGLSSVDPGFKADDLLLMSLDPGSAGYDRHRVEGFWRDALARASQVRGVQSASLAKIVPLDQSRGQRQPVFGTTSGEVLEIETNFVGPDYFRTLGIPFLAGREFDERDGKTARPIVIVNERLAGMFWPQQDPIGKGLRVQTGPSSSEIREVVGVVKDMKYRDLRGDSGPVFYQPLFQTRSTDAMTLHVRAASDPGALADAIRREMQALDANVPAFDVKTLDEQMDASFAQTRQAAAFTGGFGILALLLSGIGVYGVTALAVSRQTHDIGIRMALGARPRDIARAIGRRSVAVAAAGISLGLLGSFGFVQVTRTLLYGVTASDAATFAGMSAILALVSLTAIYVPARTATRLDAIGAIRRE